MRLLRSKSLKIYNVCMYMNKYKYIYIFIYSIYSIYYIFVIMLTKGNIEQ